MKLKNTILYLAALSLFSCEMKDEIFNKNEISGDVGYLNLAVSAQNKVTKAATDNGESPNTPVNADNFNVEICTNEGVYKKFDSYSELPETIELPVGSYTVKAHTPGEIQPKMSEPYYNGETNLKITKGTETEASVICSMQNTKVQLIYGTNFSTTFSSWVITVSDGSENILPFTEDELNPDAVYWLIADEVSEIKVHIDATLPDGGTISEDRIITKPDNAESNFWAGSDALTITMEPGKPSDPENPYGVTIDVKVEISFTNSEEVTEEIPVENGNGEESGETTDPGEGDGEDEDTTDPGEDNGPTLSGDKLNSTVTYDKGSGKPFPEVSVQMDAPGKIENVWIKVTKCTDPLLSGIFSSMGFMEDNGIDLVTTTDETLTELLDLPKKGATSYTFNLGGLGTMLTVGQHTFEVKIIDQNGKSAASSLSFDITDSTINQES